MNTAVLARFRTPISGLLSACPYQDKPCFLPTKVTVGGPRLGSILVIHGWEWEPLE
jgi:hypothetical protein